MFDVNPYKPPETPDFEPVPSESPEPKFEPSAFNLTIVVLLVLLGIPAGIVACFITCGLVMGNDLSRVELGFFVGGAAGLAITLGCFYLGYLLMHLPKL